MPGAHQDLFFDQFTAEAAGFGVTPQLLHAKPFSTPAAALLPLLRTFYYALWRKSSRILKFFSEAFIFLLLMKDTTLPAAFSIDEGFFFPPTALEY